jgi:hypothetical protein
MLEFPADQSASEVQSPQRAAAGHDVELFEQYASHVPGILYQTKSRLDGSDFAVPIISGRVPEYLGYTAAEIQAHPNLLLDAIHADDWPNCVAASRRAIAASQPLILECRVVNRTGAVRWLSVSAQPHLHSMAWRLTSPPARMRKNNYAVRTTNWTSACGSGRPS